MIDKRTIERVTEAARIEDVVGTFVELRKKGQRLLGLCPFHDDHRLGSFVVYPRKNCYKCFACEAKGGPIDFLMNYEKLSFPDAIRWLGKKYNIEVEGADTFDVTPSQPRAQLPELPTLFIPSRMVESRRSCDNTLCRWLRSLPWEPEQKRRVDTVLEEYMVGTSKYGHTIFWQIDDTGGVRTGKMMLYKPDGHRDRETRYNFDWIHSLLYKAGTFNEDEWEMRQTLFGMHLLDKYPGADVHIVESEKTALICAIWFGNNNKRVWMACGGKCNLTSEKLQAIIQERRIIALCPDKDAVNDWREQLERIGYKRAYVDTTMLDLAWQPRDGEKADMADIIVRMLDDARRERATRKLSQIVPKISPAVKVLINKFDLEDATTRE